MKCQYCKASGSNMKKCKKCGQVYCLNCALKGIGYPKIKAANMCPFCHAYNQAETAR